MEAAARPRVALRKRLALWASLATCLAVLAMSVSASSAFAGTDEFTCFNSTSAYWCQSPYQHHTKKVHAWYTGGGNLPLAVGSYSVATSTWVVYTDSGFQGYNDVYACPNMLTCNVNASTLGKMYWQNRNPSQHTVLARETF